MCRYKYMYYSGCCHYKLALFEYCDDAYNAASLPAAARDDRGEADEDGLHQRSEHVEPHSSSHSPGFPHVQNHARRRKAADEDLLGDIDGGSGTQRRQTYASVARSSTQCGSLAQTQRHKSATLASAFPDKSPAQQLASRFDQTSGTTGNSLTLDRKTAPTSRLSTNSLSKHTYGSIALATRAGWEGANRGAASAEGSRIVENTKGTPAVPRGHDTPKLNLPKPAKEACAFDLNLDSPNDFPGLRLQSQAGLSSSSFTSEPRGRSDSIASWAQVARLTSAARPSHSSTSGNTVAGSDTGTASATSFSSFQPEDFDGSLTAIKMAPTGQETVSILRGKTLPPLTTTGLSSVPQINRKTLPSEWLATSPNSSAGDVSRRKSVPSLRTAATASKAASSPTKSISSLSPGKSPTKSSTKSPTKVVPFKLETARRAAQREVKEKSSAELLRVKTKKTAKDAIDDPFSSGGLPSSSIAAARHPPHSTHATHGHNAVIAEENSWIPASPPHSRIPRLCNKFRNQEGLLSTHSESNAAIEHGGEHAQAQPSRLKTFATPGCQILAQLHTPIERRSSPTIQHIEDISQLPGGPQPGSSSKIGMARTEMKGSNKSIGNAEAAVGDIKRRMVSNSSVADSSEESTVILIGADAESDKLRSPASRTRLGTFPGALPPFKKTEQDGSARETPINHEVHFRRISLQSQDSYKTPQLRVTSNAGTDTVVTPNEPYDVVSPSQGAHWSTHYAIDLGRTAPLQTTPKHLQHRRIMSAPRMMHPNPKVLHVGPDMAKMSSPAVDLLRRLKTGSQGAELPAPQSARLKPQVKTVTTTALNAQAKEFIPQALAQTQQMSGPFVITPNPGSGFPRPQIPTEWANASWVNAIPAHQAKNSKNTKARSAFNVDAQPPQESLLGAAESTSAPGATSAGPTGKRGKTKNRVGRMKRKGVTQAVSTATSGSVANDNTNGYQRVSGVASTQHSSSDTGSNTRAPTPRPLLPSGYTTPFGSGISNPATADGSVEKTTTAAAGPYAFRWDSNMRSSAFDLTSLHTDDQTRHFHSGNTYSGAPWFSSSIAPNRSRGSNRAERSSSSSGFQFQLQRPPISSASPSSFYACTGGWRSDGGGPLRFESFRDMRASVLGVTGSQKWRPTYTHNTNSAGRNGYLGYGINVSDPNNKNANKTWGGRGRAFDGLAGKTAAAAVTPMVDYSSLAPCANVQVSEAYEVLPHCPVAVCSECLPDQTDS